MGGCLGMTAAHLVGGVGEAVDMDANPSKQLGPALSLPLHCLGPELLAQLHVLELHVVAATTGCLLIKMLPSRLE